MFCLNLGMKNRVHNKSHPFRNPKLRVIVSSRLCSAHKRHGGCRASQIAETIEGNSQLHPTMGGNDQSTSKTQSLREWLLNTHQPQLPSQTRMKLPKICRRLKSTALVQFLSQWSSNAPTLLERIEQLWAALYTRVWAGVGWVTQKRTRNHGKFPGEQNHILIS